MTAKQHVLGFKLNSASGHSLGCFGSSRPVAAVGRLRGLGRSDTAALGFAAAVQAQQPSRRTCVQVAAGRQEAPPDPAPKRIAVKQDAAAVVPEAHKVFDEIVINVKAGAGGNGEVVPAGRGRYVPNHKYKPGGNQPKTIWLPASEPGDGADGGDVVLVCDPGVDSLLHLHAGSGGAGGKKAAAGKGDAARPTFAARDGSNANPNTGSGGPKRNADIKKAKTPALEIPVPPGTVVKRKGTGALLGELLQPGQRLVVARGGAGGHGVMAPSREQNRARVSRAEREARNKGVEVVEVDDAGWREDVKGQPGQQLGLTLLLRVVADVGLVGFPNAGKSSLLKSLTRASPTIAPYPFTTLMPNLGVLSAGGGANKAVLADLPGLIEGAHKGRGLGRNFLRHLRRTSALLHVLDASAPDPVTDYYAVREELRMYNPDYCARPHVVALNKMDLLAAAAAAGAGASEEAAAAAVVSRMKELVTAIRGAAQTQAAEHAEHSYEGPVPVPPISVVPCSAATGEGLKELAAALQRALGAARVAEPDVLRSAPDTLAEARGNTTAAAAAPPATTTAAAVSALSASSARKAAAAAAAEGAERQPVASTSGRGAPAAVAAGAGAAAAGAGVAMASAAAVGRRKAAAMTPGAPPPPPAGWDDGSSSGGGGGGWGADANDAAADLSPEELAAFNERCRSLGLIDEKGNFTGVRLPDDEEAAAVVAAGGSSAAGFAEDDLNAASPWLDAHGAHSPGAGAGMGDTMDAADGGGEPDWMAELEGLDEQAMAAVLAELEAEEAAEAAAAAAAAPLTSATGRTHQQQQARTRTAAAATAAANNTEGDEGEGDDGDEDGDGEALVKMAGADDPDAALVGLSLEQLLAMEKDDWPDNGAPKGLL
ncbi:hypothetical protein HYH02_001203 [Chlamydomonas schloesseri]|uniref:Obg domain-containing protein n=1 Tax=Chlamydomonas schloesseri TaxID=2026947 RepID=A0A835WTY4_9CHLO|nr:hypothetical protein HYH02_001203 [Chlamydomonas schloesseri]|eukprot:KAG2454168.1 hypothetical protein HYH02_001203 [Chlamydomonas schloesseri]